VNYWKSAMRDRWATAQGDPGCLTLWGSSPEEHRLWAEHMTAEVPTRTTGRGRNVEEWKVIVGRDNHWLDCLVGCAVAASMLGVLLGTEMTVKRKKVDFGAMQRQARRKG
jgi:hypothetical protein